MAGYWEGRKHLNYYRVMRELLESLGPRESIVDVGAWDTPVVTWGEFDARFTVDPRERPAMDGVVAIRATWPVAAVQVLPPVSVVMCLQVIEHLVEPRAFCESLFAAAKECVILSVPYQWPAGACQYHVHDPVDEEKLAQFVGREPTRSTIVREQDSWHRLIAVYEVAYA